MKLKAIKDKSVSVYVRSLLMIPVMRLDTRNCATRKYVNGMVSEEKEGCRVHVKKKLVKV